MKKKTTTAVPQYLHAGYPHGPVTASGCASGVRPWAPLRATRDGPNVVEVIYMTLYQHSFNVLDNSSRQTHRCTGLTICLTFDTRGLFSIAWKFLRVAP